MKKILAATLIAAMCLAGLAGCGSKPAAAPAPEASKTESQAEAVVEAAEAAGIPENATCVYVSRSLADEFGALIAYDLQAVVKEKFPGWNFSIMDSDNDASKQLEFMENAMSSNVDVLVVQPVADSNTLAASQEAMDQGMLVINYEVPFDESSIINPLVYSSFYDSYRVIMEYAVDAVPENAKICVLSGIEGFGPTVEREVALNEFLEKRTDVEVLEYQYAQYETDKAMNIMEDWLGKYDQIDAVLCLTDTMALGVCEAYRSAGIDSTDVWICGVDSLSNACEYIATGEISASVFRAPRSFSNACVGLIEEFYTGNLDMTKQVMCNNDIVVTQENVADIQAQLDIYK